MTSAVLYGTTSDNELRPVQVTDSGEFVTDGGGGGDWYENFYVGGTEGAPSISLLDNGSITAAGYVTTQGFNAEPTNAGYSGLTVRNPDDGTISIDIQGNGSITAAGVVYAENFIPNSGFDLNKIGQALSTIYDVIDSVDDIQGLKNLFHLLLDNLKSDPTPPPPPTEPTS